MAERELPAWKDPAFFLVSSKKGHSAGGGSKPVKAMGKRKFKNFTDDRAFYCYLSSGGEGFL